MVESTNKENKKTPWNKKKENKVPPRNKKKAAVLERQQKLFEILRNHPEGVPVTGEDGLCMRLSDTEFPLGRRTVEIYARQMNEELEQEGSPYRIQKLMGRKNYWILQAQDAGSPQKLPREDRRELLSTPVLDEKEDAEEAIYLFLLCTVFYGEKEVKKQDFLDFLYGRKCYISQYPKFTGILNRMQDKNLIRITDDRISVCTDERKLLILDASERIRQGVKYVIPQYVTDATYKVMDELMYYEGKLNEHLKALKKRYELVTQGGEMDEQACYVYRDRAGSEVENARLISEKLSGIEYKTHVIRITYNTDTRQQSADVKTGLLHFSKNKDTLYLLGKDKDNNIVNIKVPDIQTVEELTDKNEEYDSTEMNRIYNEMFDAAYEDELYDVKVRVLNHGQVVEKFRQLAAAREMAQLVQEENMDSYIYTDSIRGISDFAEYLSQYGKSCIVQSPPVLCDKVYDLAMRILRLYDTEK